MREKSSLRYCSSLKSALFSTFQNTAACAAWTLWLRQIDGRHTVLDSGPFQPLHQENRVSCFPTYIHFKTVGSQRVKSHHWSSISTICFWNGANQVIAFNLEFPQQYEISQGSWNCANKAVFRKSHLLDHWKFSELGRDGTGQTTSGNGKRLQSNGTSSKRVDWPGLWSSGGKCERRLS
jgi:hypothetical protein